MNPPLCKIFNPQVRVVASGQGYTYWAPKPGTGEMLDVSVQHNAAPYTNYQCCTEELRTNGTIDMAGVAPWPGDAVAPADLARHEQQMASLAG